MAKFAFKLEGVLRHRKTVEAQRQREVAQVQAQMTRLEAQLRALDASVQATSDDVRQNRLVGTIDVNFLTAHRRYLMATQKQAVEIAERMAQVQIKLDEARRILVAAATDRKILEKLRERQELAWREDMARKENAALDEVVTQMSFRRKDEAAI